MCSVPRPAESLDVSLRAGAALYLLARVCVLVHLDGIILDFPTCDWLTIVIYIHVHSIK